MQKGELEKPSGWPVERLRREIGYRTERLRVREAEEKEAWGAWQRAEVAQNRAFRAYQASNVKRAKAEATVEGLKARLAAMISKQGLGNGNG